MRSFCVSTVIVVLFCAAVIAAKEMPAFPCTFSTRMSQTMRYKTAVSLYDRIQYTLKFSRSSKLRLEAREALTKLNNGESVTGFDENEMHEEFDWYSVENQLMSQFLERNISMYWNNSGVALEILPFFDRFFAVRIVSPDAPMSCPEPMEMEMEYIEVQPCPNHPGMQCDVYRGSDGKFTQTVLMVSNTNILDVLEADCDFMNTRSDFIGFDTSVPDISHFIPPKYPVTDFTTIPAYQKRATWTAKKYPGKKFPLNPLSKALFPDNVPQYKYSFVAPNRSSRRVAIPDSFDARDNWPNCPTIKQIRNQQRCGSCWAFGAAETFGDRYCITTGNSISFSPQFLVNCYDDNKGCNGGALDLTWLDLMEKGVVPESCKPYRGKDEKCTDTCDNHRPMTKYYAKSAYSPYAPYDIEETVRLIQEEIMTNGPVEAGFYVFEDFDSYRSGVYQRRSVVLSGAHAVKIIGWGTDKTTHIPYWLIANSWGESWGERGFFRMRRGTNECNIENEVVAGLIMN